MKIDGDLAELGNYGATKVLSNKSITANDAAQITNLVAAAAESSSATTIIMSLDLVGRSVAPRLSAKLKAGLASGAIALPEGDGKIRVNVFSGKAYGHVSVNTDKKIITLTPNSMQVEKGGVLKSQDNYLKIKDALQTVMISGGETKTTRFAFRDWIDRGAYDIVQADCNIVGITENWHIARMAHLKDRICCPHSWHGGLTKMSNAHLVAGIPNHLLLEVNQHYNPFQTELFKEPMIVKNSYIDLTDKPGLGIEIIDNPEQKFPYDPKNHWQYGR